MSTQLKLTNNAVARLAGNVGLSTSTAQLESGKGAKFPATNDGLPFYVTATTPAGEHEIWKVIDRSFDVLTILRAQEGTTALAFYTGDIIELRLTAGALMAELNRLDAKVNAAVQAFANPTYTLPTGSQIAAALAGQLSTDAFISSLASRINLIDGGNDVIGSVNARVKAETDTRVASIQQEIDDRINAVNAEAGARTSYVQTYTYNKDTIDGAIAYSASVVTANYTGYVNAAVSGAVATAAADVRSYAYSKSAIDSAEATQLSTITANYTTYANSVRDAAIATAGADVRNYSYAKAATDSAIAASESRLRSEFVGSGGATEAYVTSYAYSRSDIDAAESSQTSAITAAYTTAANNARDAAISTASADVRSYSYAKATIDSAISSSVAQVTARLDNIGGVTVEQKFTAQAGVNTGLSAQATVKIDNNGYVTGYGLASTPVNGVPQSVFAILADKFQVVGPSGPIPMFSVGGGTVGFSGELKGPTGTLGSLKLLDGKGLTGGAFSTKPDAQEWPDAGSGAGFQLGNGALRLGNFNDGKYLFLGYDGNLLSGQFTIINGAATFSGALSAASGTFTGTLSAASGTFSGTLTADEVITRGNLQAHSTSSSDLFSSISGATAFVVGAGGADVIINGRVGTVAGQACGFDLYYEGLIGYPGSLADRVAFVESSASAGSNTMPLTIQGHLNAGTYYLQPYNTASVVNVAILKVYK